MKVAVIGLWHLGCVTAACLAKLGHSVIAYDEDISCIAKLNNNEMPIYEPNLFEYIVAAKQANNLHFSNHLSDISHAEIIWVTYDTDVDDLGRGDVHGIKKRLIQLFPYFKENTLIIISSQLPVGTTQEISISFKQKFQKKTIEFVYSPENLRLGQAIALFLNPDRIIMGISSIRAKKCIRDLLYPIADKIIWMSIKSAEMTKHAINAFLATSIAFINELALLCETLGVNVKEVEDGLKTDSRIGQKAYLKSGAPFSGHTLVRDVNYLLTMKLTNQLSMDLLSAILSSNEKHIQWMKKKLNTKFKELNGKKIAILGLAYKLGTSCIKQSLVVKLSLWLHEQGVNIKGYDPMLKSLSPTLNLIISLQQDICSALHQADCVLIGSIWPELLTVTAEQFVAGVKKPYIFDPNGFLSKQLEGDRRIDYYRVGMSY